MSNLISNGGVCRTAPGHDGNRSIPMYLHPSAKPTNCQPLLTVTTTSEDIIKFQNCFTIYQAFQQGFKIGHQLIVYTTKLTRLITFFKRCLMYSVVLKMAAQQSKLINIQKYVSYCQAKFEVIGPKTQYERVQPFSVISLSCNWVIFYNEIEHMQVKI